MQRFARDGPMTTFMAHQEICPDKKDILLFVLKPTLPLKGWWGWGVGGGKQRKQVVKVSEMCGKSENLVV